MYFLYWNLYQPTGILYTRISEDEKISEAANYTQTRPHSIRRNIKSNKNRGLYQIFQIFKEGYAGITGGIDWGNKGRK